jgi:Helix-turn-helix domain
MVLLTLAEFADAAGECWPGVDLIAKSGRISKRNVLRGLDRLETYGWIRILRKSRDHKGNSYRISLKKLNSPGASVAPVGTDLRDTVAPESVEVRCQNQQSQVPNQQESGAKSDEVRCQISIPFNRNHQEPSMNRQEPPKRTNTFVLPDWVPVEPWNHFMEMRRKNRKTPTDRAKQLLVEKLARLTASGQDLEEIINQSIESSWTGLFEIKQGRNGSAGFNRAQTATDSAIASGRAALQAFGFDCGTVDEAGGDDGRADGFGRRSVTVDGRRARRLIGG